ncbi:MULTISPECIES: DUF5665 domain-containing protein [Caloranaerobacter]|uniref:Uncharacterized protein n=3 Tax=Caloranaerobacter azorensis TaxID=116090 RepID=A0A1M5V298_9FIRM|nr:DUF5665 domain-containing protein [Caloranaerobacter azorensis]KGG80194.1 hypothetical protein Y919_07770 [Caloranaerobacter azorensis H53214]QIB26662.1 hypothetical protein G3A45_04700 [Caloranaerobacter azorensis]SHH69284.1 hypothetical protein SAMN02745135_01696 [Caloranaerobacter azorensis DSM 13643]
MQEKELEKKIHEIALQLEKAKIAEYVDILNNRKRLLYINFIGGLARGFGMAVGFTILGAFVIYILQKMISWNLPLIGDFIADLVKIVQENL